MAGNLIRKWRAYRRDPKSFFLFLSVWFAALLTMLALIFMIAYILIKGIPNLTLDLFDINYTTENVSLLPALINTLFLMLLSLLFAVPVGIGAAIYLTEYARRGGLRLSRQSPDAHASMFTWFAARGVLRLSRQSPDAHASMFTWLVARGNKLISIVGITAETLSGIPSIVYGLFGSLFFVKYLGLGLSLLSGALTLSIMILPLIMRTTEEALRSVPDSYREGSFGLGAGRLRTVFSIVLPCAVPGILSGVILGIGRIVGESAALIFTAGTVAEIAASIFSSARTLSVHMYSISGEGLYIEQTYATAVVLLIVVILINGLSGFAAKKIGGNNTDG